MRLERPRASGGTVRVRRRARRLYGSARAFAFLSEYEGLGLTPLEALAAGVPPVLLDTPVARESCGERRALRRHARRRRRRDAARSSSCCSTSARARGCSPRRQRALATLRAGRAPRRDTLAVCRTVAGSRVIDLSIIIVSYNARADLERCLAVAARRAAGRRARDHRRRQRVDRRQRRAARGSAGGAGHRGRRRIAGSRRPTMSASAPAAADCCCC